MAAPLVYFLELLTCASPVKPITARISLQSAQSDVYREVGGHTINIPALQRSHYSPPQFSQLSKEGFRALQVLIKIHKLSWQIRASELALALLCLGCLRTHQLMGSQLYSGPPQAGSALSAQATKKDPVISNSTQEWVIHSVMSSNHQQIVTKQLLCAWPCAVHAGNRTEASP